MEFLLNNPTYQYFTDNNSEINVNEWINCSFISSFQIQMKKKYNDFPTLLEILEKFYSNKKGQYLRLAEDFPLVWNELKKYLIEQDIKWQQIFDNIILRIHLPVFNIDMKVCVLLSYVDMNKININKYNHNIMEAFIESVADTNIENKETIDILQNRQYFEPINIIKQIGVLENLSKVL